MPVEQETIRRILLKQGYVTEEDLQKAEQEAESERSTLVNYLFSHDLLNRVLLGQAMAEHYDVPFTDLEKEQIDDEVFFRLPEQVARVQSVIAMRHVGDKIRIAMTDPTDISLVRLVEQRLGSSVMVTYAGESDIARTFRRYQANLKSRYEKAAFGLEAITPETDPEEQADIRDRVITKIVDIVMEAAYIQEASDVHLDPFDDHCVVRVRVDGILHDILSMPMDIYDSFLSRIKVLSKMRTDEHRAAQDGKFRFVTKDGKNAMDVRVSVVPAGGSENIVMRVLSSQGRYFGLHELGFQKHDLNKIMEGIKTPHGMILVSGPTGSGKTTTLYSVLRILNRREVNIATIEDPVEFAIEGITQIQVNVKTNLTFASGLRAIVRQDPDIIMVGEVRDEETAGISVNSALTGHLVLSTIHTNDASTTLPRLLDMDIEPFLIASTVNLIIAQRLVRIICRSCIQSYTLDKKQVAFFSKHKHLSQYLKKFSSKSLDKIRMYRGAGCNVCGDTGYQGRIGIFEVLPISDEIRGMIMSGGSADEIEKQAVKEGMITLMEDGLRKVLEGTTTIDEVLRVAIK